MLQPTAVMGDPFTLSLYPRMKVRRKYSQGGVRFLSLNPRGAAGRLDVAEVCSARQLIFENMGLARSGEECMEH